MTIDDPPRLVIERIVLENFKSYAGRIEIGPFHKSFTAIVGPNGSGKSNVIDALLFVFGFKAKKMRQENLAGLVHKSNTHPNLEWCSAEVHFCEIQDSEDDYRVVDGSQLVVARHASVFNKSNYYLNGKSSSYGEITTLLKEKGIDLDHKRFLILQGEVESISQMKPKGSNEHEEGLLEYLEDIIGTSKYKQLIDENFQLYEKLNDQRVEKLNSVRVVEAELNAIEDEKTQAEEYLREERRLNYLKAKLYAQDIETCEQNIQENKLKETQLKHDISEQQKIVEGEEKKKTDLKQQYDALNKDVKHLSKQYEKSAEELKQREKDSVAKEEKKKHLNHKRKKLQKQLDKDRNAVSELQTWEKNFMSDKARIEGEVEKHVSALAAAQDALKKICDQLQDKTEPIQVKLDEKKQALAPWMANINKTKSDIHIKQSEVDLLEKEQSSVGSQLSHLEETLKATEMEIASKSSMRQKAEMQLESTSVDLKEASSMVECLTTKERELQEKVSGLVAKLNQAKTSALAASSRSDVVALLFRERDEGRIPGIYGRLCELGTIDAKYDVAVSSAFRDKLEWIVVDTVTTAEQCLEVLKSNRGGRTSFIVMEKASEMSPTPNTPEHVPRMVDLIKPKRQEFLKAFFHVMRDTLIAEDQEQANRVAFGKTRWKTVTLDGNVIEKSGTITGGGSSQAAQKGKSRGSALTQSFSDEMSKEEMSHAEKELANTEKELGKTSKTLASETDRFNSLNDTVSQITKSRNLLESELNALSTKFEGMRSEIAELKKLSKTFDPRMNEAKIKQLSADIQLLKNKEMELKDSCAGIQEEITQLQEQILRVGGDQLRRQNLRIKDLEDELTSSREELQRLLNKQKSNEKSLKKSSESYKAAEKEIKQIEKEIDALESEEDSSVSKDQQRQCDALKFQLEEMQEKLSDLKERMDASSSSSVQKQLIKLQTQLKELQQETLAYKARLDKLNDMRGKLNLEEGMTEEEEEISPASLAKEVLKLEARLSKMSPNLSVLDEHRRLFEEFTNRARVLEQITLARNDTKQKYDELRKTRLEEFMAGFAIISQKMKEMYQLITLGGNAELEPVDSLDPFSEGILFSVMPPKKSWKNIANLSGGEKTLSSLALVFALHYYKPTPLYVMDEIDAALDFRNVSIIANYIKERTKNAQFVIISLRNDMFELANRLVGIYKTHNCTKSISINVNDFLLTVQ